ncbi:hypothetical protein PR048_021452 [Dryococelus australis]|uniref:Uncharacterized protein n=1 Tax=Dryococelus australis TaxID=614101 RepID=A0ABQ9GYA8_9NEOP|nr:hypothetical protein PR048_021452 [Dryococelus australis]
MLDLLEGLCVSVLVGGASSESDSSSGSHQPNKCFKGVSWSGDVGCTRHGELSLGSQLKDALSKQGLECWHPSASCRLEVVVRALPQAAELKEAEPWAGCRREERVFCRLLSPNCSHCTLRTLPLQLAIGIRKSDCSQSKFRSLQHMALGQCAPTCSPELLDECGGGGLDGTLVIVMVIHEVVLLGLVEKMKCMWFPCWKSPKESYLFDFCSRVLQCWYSASLELWTMNAWYMDLFSGLALLVLGWDSILGSSVYVQCNAEYIGLTSNALAENEWPQRGHQTSPSWANVNLQEKPAAAHAASHNQNFDSCYTTRVPMRVIEVSMMQRQNERAAETGNPQENQPTNGIIRHNSHMRKSGVTWPEIEPGSP